MDKPGLISDDSGQTHCAWRTAAPEYRVTTTTSGVPVADDVQL
jgi:DNA-3-methyladenine glycosylase I